MGIFSMIMEQSEKGRRRRVEVFTSKRRKVNLRFWKSGEWKEFVQT